MLKKLFLLLLVSTLTLTCMGTLSSCTPDELEGTSAESLEIPDVPETPEVVMLAYAKAAELGYDGTLDEFLALCKGKDGKDGVSITDVYVENGDMFVVLSDETEIPLGNVIGPAGADGVGIEKALIDDEGNLVVYYTDKPEEGVILGKVTGEKGENGIDGVGIAKTFINDDGNLVVYYTNAPEEGVILGKVTGEKGENGIDGVGIAKTLLDKDGNLIVYYTNAPDEAIVLGRVVGEKGDKGEQGETGENGVGIANAYVDEDGDLIVYYTNAPEIGVNIGHVRGDDDAHNGENFVGGTALNELTFDADGRLTVRLTNSVSFVRILTVDSAFAEHYSALYVGIDRTVYVTTVDGALMTEYGTLAELVIDEKNVVTLYMQEASVLVLGTVGTVSTTPVEPDKEPSVEPEHPTDAPEIPSEPSIPSAPTKEPDGGDKTEATAAPTDAPSVDEYQTVTLDSGLVLTRNENGTYTVSHYKGTDTHVEIPDALPINGEYYSVVSVDRKAFAGSKLVTSVTVGENVVEIGKYAFSDCVNLRTITLPASLQRIAQGAFNACDSLEEVAYNGTEEDFMNLSIADGNEPILVVLYPDNEGGDEPTVEVEVPTFGPIVEPTDEPIVEPTAAGDVETATCEEPSKEESSEETDDGYLNVDGFLLDWGMDGEGYTVVDYVGEKTDVLNIPEASYDGIPVIAIADKAFYFLTSVTHVYIPRSVTSIGVLVFCDSAPTDIYYAGTEAEWAKVTIGDGNELLLKATVHFTDEGDIEGGEDEPTTEPDVETEVPDEKTEAPSVETEMPDVETEAPSVDDVTVTMGNFVLVQNDDGTYTVSQYCGTDEYVEIPSSYASADGIAFAITGIGVKAFAGNDLLTTVYISEGITSIDDAAFAYCVNLVEVHLPATLTYIGNYAFDGCDSLSVATYRGPAEAWYALTVCAGNDALLALLGYDYEGDEDEPTAEPEVETEVPDEKTEAPDVETEVPDEKTEAPSGEETSAPEISDEEGYAALGWYFLSSDDGSSYIVSKYEGDETDVVVPSSCNGRPITGIGDSAFQNNENLTSVNLPATVTSIGASAFFQCTKLVSINLPYGLLSIGDSAFFECTSLQYVDFPETLTYIGTYAFAECSILESAVLLTEMTDISDYTFFNCKNLQYVELPVGLTNIGTYSFARCSSLTSIEIPENVTNIWGDTFENCSALTSIYLPANVRGIYDFAFYGCDSLTDIYYNGTEEEWANVYVGPGNPFANATVHYTGEAAVEDGKDEVTDEETGDGSEGETEEPTTGNEGWTDPAGGTTDGSTDGATNGGEGEDGTVEDETTASHDHVWGDWIVGSMSENGEYANIYRECTVDGCDATETQESIPNWSETIK